MRALWSFGSLFRSNPGSGQLFSTSTCLRRRLYNPACSLHLVRRPVSSLGAVQGAHQKKKLVVYSKEGCCLCEGVKEKLEQVAALGGAGPLFGVEMEVRDITTNPEWERAYQYEIPVLARVRGDDTEEVLPRMSPRMGLEQICKRLSVAFSD